MKEYKIKKNITEEQLNQYASEGWEIISVYPVSFKHYFVNQYDITQLGVTMCREKKSDGTRNIRRYRKVEDRFNKRQKVEEKLKQIMEDRFGVDRVLINNETTPYDLGLDSLDTVEYMMEIERAYNIDIRDEDFSHDSISFSDMVDCVLSKISSKK